MSDNLGSLTVKHEHTLTLQQTDILQHILIEEYFCNYVTHDLLMKDLRFSHQFC
jgi:hypothetical protein